MTNFHVKTNDVFFKIFTWSLFDLYLLKAYVYLPELKGICFVVIMYYKDTNKCGRLSAGQNSLLIQKLTIWIVLEIN